MRRWLAGATIALGLAGVTAIPAAAKDTYPFFGPLGIQIVGADGDIRQFLALSAEDRSGAATLVRQLTNAFQGEGNPVDTNLPALPHYRIGVSHLGLNAPTMPWSRASQTTFFYYPGGDGPSVLVAEFSQDNDALQARSIQTPPDVAALIQRHLVGLAPLAGGEPAKLPEEIPWSILAGAALLAIIIAILAEDRRRWRLHKEGAPAKGT